jgi:DNA polymerase I-like protein with 3'-5' exonuclease and polymerase domains
MDEIETWSAREEQKATEQIRILSSVRIGLGECMKTGPLELALNKVGVTVPRSPTGKASITKEWLEALEHPLGAHIRRARQMDKIRSTFLKSWRTHAIGDRLHCTLNQLRAERDDGGAKGTVSGRLSGCDPNPQQIPGRDPELGPLLRSVWLPDEGMKWASIDYSAQEPRMTIHYAALQNLRGAAEAVDYYINDPAADHHNMTATMIWGEGFTKANRKQAKEIFLGLAYGMGGAKLCHRLGLPTEWVWSERWGKQIEVPGPEGKALLREFDERVPFVKKLSYRVKERAEKRGWIRTLLGRRCRFPVNQFGKHEYHKALNRLIQGSCADMTKQALLDCFAAGHIIQMQVHDELCASVRDEAHSNEIAEIMSSTVKLKLPMAVDVELGESWGDSMVA